MDSKRFKFLKSLMDTMSPTGFEEEAARIWRKEAEKFSRTYTDTHGNSFAVLGFDLVNTPKVMLAGHIDEIGLMVQYIDEQGFIYFTGIGGWDTQILPGQHVNIKTGSGLIPGVIGRAPIHLLSADERKKVVKFDDLWIDIGAKNYKEASSVVSVGDPAVIDRGIRRLKNDLVAGRAFDDKIGAFVALEALRILSEKDINVAVYAVATTQEEIGTRGAITSAFSVSPDVGFAIDVGFTSDTPGSNKKKIGDLKIGAGPSITRGPNVNPILFKMIVDLAEKNHIPFQINADSGVTGTDARSIQVSKKGVPTALISIPNRYMHSPCEMVSLKDVVNASKLIACVIASINSDTNFKIY